MTMQTAVKVVGAVVGGKGEGLNSGGGAASSTHVALWVLIALFAAMGIIGLLVAFGRSTRRREGSPPGTTPQSSSGDVAPMWWFWGHSTAGHDGPGDGGDGGSDGGGDGSGGGGDGGGGGGGGGE